MNTAVRVCCASATAGILISGAALAKTTEIGKAEVVVPNAMSTSVEQEVRNLQVGTDVFKDDVVKTGNIGAVMLQFTDKTTLKIFPNSNVKLDNYVYDSEKTVLRVGLSLLSGAMRIASGGPHTADKYQLRTPQATIGIRGTVIHIVSDDERTVVEALHGSFHACATTGSACQTVSATDDMNALHLWSDGRIELARARRDLGVRAALGSSDATATSPAQLNLPIAQVGDIDRTNRGNEANSQPVAGLFQFDGFGFFSGSNPGSGRSAQCFVAGTKILTPEGEQAVETLRVGDRVVTTSGPAKVRWIAKQTFRRKVGQPWPSAIQPVLIEPNAIAPNAPCRTLVLSPAHSLFLDGWLVPAEKLVNDRTIRKTDHPGQTLEYFSVVLDNHNVIFANNLAVESWHAYDAHDQVYWDNFAAFRNRYPRSCDDVFERFAPRVAGRQQRLKDKFSSFVAFRKPREDPVTSIRRRLPQR